MARFPGAKWRPLADGHQVAMARYDLVILHTMVGNLTGTDNMFAKNGWSGTESHFGVGGPWGDDKDGVVYQWNDTKWRSDANLEANDRAISIETGDNAPKFTKDVKPWTDKQLDAIVDLVAWACRTHDIPAVLVPDSKPTRRGIAFHQQGCEHSDGIGSHPDFLVKGGERWSTSLGKECPTAARIKQVKTIIVPRVAARLRGEDDEMALDSKETRAAAKAGFLDALEEKVIENVPVHEGDVQGANWSLRTWAQAQDRKQDLRAEADNAMKADLASLKAAQNARDAADARAAAARAQADAARDERLKAMEETLAAVLAAVKPTNGGAR